MRHLGRVDVAGADRGDRALRSVAAIGALLVAGGISLWLFAFDGKVDTYGPSMNPTLRGAVALEIEWDAYRDLEPAIGEVVVLQGPRGLDDGRCGSRPRPGAPCAMPIAGYSREHLIKRVVAGPGQTIAFAPNGGVVRDGKRVEEPYIRPCAGGCALPRAIEVPVGHYFVAGDNRGRSVDSRHFGPIPREAIDGRAVAPADGL